MDETEDPSPWALMLEGFKPMAARAEAEIKRNRAKAARAMRAKIGSGFSPIKTPLSDEELMRRQLEIEMKYRDRYPATENDSPSPEEMGYRRYNRRR